FVDHLDGVPVEIAGTDSGIEVLEILERASESLTSAQKTSVAPPAKPPPDYFVHPSSFVDEPVEIGDGTKIWHYCHVQANVVIGKGCSFGQNANVASNVRIGNYVKVQNNVSIYEGVELKDY